MNLKAASDEALLKAVEGKNIAAFQEFYDRHVLAVFAVAYRVIGNKELAEDVIQDTFLKLWRQSERFEPGLGAARPWLIAMVRNRAFDITRRPAFRRQSLTVGKQMFEPNQDVAREVTQSQGDSGGHPQLTDAEETNSQVLTTRELEPSTRQFIVYAKIAIGRVLSESRFFANTVKEAFLHPLATSAIDKRTGKVIKQARVDWRDILEENIAGTEAGA